MIEPDEIDPRFLFNLFEDPYLVLRAYKVLNCRVGVNILTFVHFGDPNTVLINPPSKDAARFLRALNLRMLYHPLDVPISYVHN